MKKIRILFLHSTLVCGGAEQALFDLCCLLDHERFDVTVLVQHPGGIWDQKFRNAGIKVIDMWDCQKKSRNPIIKLQNYIKRKKLTYYINCGYRGLIDGCFGNKYDILISFAIWNNHHIGVSRYAKTIKYIHGDVRTYEPLRNNILDINHLLPTFDRFICVSNVAKDSFQELTGIADNVEAIWNPINSKLIHQMANDIVDIPIDVPVVCAVGRLSEEKGFERLVRIHKRILDMHIPHKLIIVGGGAGEAELKQVIAGTGTEASVIMPGYTPNPYPYMKNSTFMVCSSYSEGLSLIALEGLSLGIPIVSAVPSIRELFGAEVCGIVTENDDDSLMEGIVKMLTDHDFYAQAKAGAEARSTVFDGKTMVRKVEKVFIDLVDSK